MTLKEKKNMNHPIQPLEEDEFGVIRFKSNAIVRFLLDNGSFDMNTIALKNFSNEDREQFAQLIGYSLGGFGDLSYVSNETYETAHIMSVTKKSESEARIEYLEGIIENIKDNMKNFVIDLFNIHPDDLE